MSWEIRKGTSDDAKRINELFTEMLMTIHGSDREDGYEDGYLDRFFSGGEDIVFIAEQDCVTVGFISVEVHCEEPEHIYIDDFSVTSRCRNRGIGSALLGSAESYASSVGVDAAVLHVEKQNTDALRFYRRNGYSIFRDDGERLLLLKQL